MLFPWPSSTQVQVEPEGPGVGLLPPFLVAKYTVTPMAAARTTAPTDAPIATFFFLVKGMSFILKRVFYFMKMGSLLVGIEPTQRPCAHALPTEEQKLAFFQDTRVGSHFYVLVLHHVGPSVPAAKGVQLDLLLVSGQQQPE